MMTDWTLFLDRDGVINEHPSTHYVLSWNDFQFRPGVLSSIAELSTIFKNIFVVTNQQGVGKGLMSQEDLNNIHNNMSRAIEAFGGKINEIQACTDLATNPDHGRKPRVNMALNLELNHPQTNFKKSVMVGDQITDMMFGQALGMKCVHVENKAKKVTFEKELCPHLAYENLSDFVHYLKDHHEEFLRSS